MRSFRRCGPACLLAVAVAFTFSLFTIEEAEARRYASMVVDAETGQVLYARNADRRNYPASLTKIMTLYMAFEALERGELKLDQPLPVSKRAAGMPPSKLGLRQGQTIKVRDVILALVTKSANDAAVVLAEALAGKETTFAKRMTEKAQALGMTKTTFRNASGLPNRAQKSTARDMITLGRTIHSRFPGFYKYYSTKNFTYRGRTYRNHNRLLRNYSGTDGIKTGYIRASGFNLLASVRRDGRHLIAVVFGGKSAKSRDAHMRKLLDRSFSRIAVAGIKKTPAPPARNPRDPIGLQPVLVASAAPAAMTPAGVTAAVEEGSGSSVAPTPAAKPSSIRPQDVTKAARMITRPKPAAQGRQNLAAAQVAGVAGTDAGEIETTRDWGIQVGAFRRFSPAHKAAVAAARRLPELLTSTKLEISHASDDQGEFYRAKLIGLAETQAREACNRLEAGDMACVVIPPATSG